MAKKTDYKGMAIKDLEKALADARTKLREIRFDMTGAALQKAHEKRELKKSVARILTELTNRSNS